MASITSGRVIERWSLLPTWRSPPKSAGAELDRLDLRAHRAVEDDGPALDQIQVRVAGHPGDAR